MNQKEIEAYKAGFLNGIDLKENYKVQIMGYDLFKIFDILEKHMTHEKKKMTRAEAIIMLKRHFPFATDSEKTIDFYIEAGMLEIVEEKKPISVFAEIALKYIKDGKYLEFLSEMDKSGIKMVFKP